MFTKKNNMKERILSNWTFRRILFVGVGLFVVVNSFLQKENVGIFMGLYLLSMGVFSFGCANNCGISTTNKTVSSNSFEDVQFEEVK